MTYRLPQPGAALADAIEEQQRRQAERVLRAINRGRKKRGLPPLAAAFMKRVDADSEPWSPALRFWTRPGEGGET